MDADTVAIKDFRDISQLFLASPYHADILMSLATSHPLSPTLKLKQPPSMNAGIMYFKCNQRSINFLTTVIRRLESDRKLLDQDAFRQSVEEVRHVELTGSFFLILGIGVVPIDHVQVDENGLEYNIEDEAGDTETSTGYRFLEIATHFFYGSETESTEKVRIHFLDPLEFMNGPIYYQHTDLIPANFDGYMIIHSNDQKDVRESMFSRGLWHLTDEGKCKGDISL